MEKLYVIKNIRGKYWKKPGEGTTKNVAKAYRYTKEQSKEHQLPGHLEAICVNDIKSIQLQMPAYNKKLSKFVFRCLLRDWTIDHTSKHLFIQISDRCHVRIPTDYINPLINVYKDNEIKFTISLNSFDWNSFEIKDGTKIFYEDVFIVDIL